MSLLKLAPRPLMREERTFRDDRLFIVGCDDRYAPKQYFDFFHIVRVHVYVVATEDCTSTASAVLNRVLEAKDKYGLESDDQIWMVLDTDHCVEGTHLMGFMAALAEARRKGINVALSRPCFEMWLLLHYAQAGEVLELKNADEVQAALRERLGEYNKTNLKKEHFAPENVAHACTEAQKLDEAVGGGEIPARNSSRVYLLMKALCHEIAGGATVCSASRPSYLHPCNREGEAAPVG